MEAGVHLPQIDLEGTGFSSKALFDVVDPARECGFAAVSANDHFVFRRPWLDGLTALAVVAERARPMTLMTSVALPVLRGPVPLAAAATALDVIAAGQVVLGVAVGSSRADYEALGVPFAERWERFDEATGALRALLADADADAAKLSGRIPVWIGSWGSPVGLQRVARLGDGWLASAYNCDPEAFAAGLTALERLRPGPFPHALVTMWTWITDRPDDAGRKLDEVARLVGRDPATLAGRLCIGSPEQCAELLSRYAQAGCRRVHFWPLGDGRRQIERLAGEVLPLVSAPD